MRSMRSMRSLQSHAIFAAFPQLSLEELQDVSKLAHKEYERRRVIVYKQFFAKYLSLWECDMYVNHSYPHFILGQNKICVQWFLHKEVLRVSFTIHGFNNMGSQGDWLVSNSEDSDEIKFEKLCQCTLIKDESPEKLRQLFEVLNDEDRLGELGLANP